MSVVQRTRRAALVAVAVLAVAVVVVVVVRTATGDDRPGPADAKLAAKIRTAGITPYLIDLDGATVTKVRVRDDYPHLVMVDYDGDDGYSFTLGLSRATPGELCKNGHEEYKEGGSCTSHGNRMTTEFEEMGTFTERKGDTDVYIDTVIESDPGLPERAFKALDEARKVSVDELARY